jgi:hypothetical protein
VGRFEYRFIELDSRLRGNDRRGRQKDERKKSRWFATYDYILAKTEEMDSRLHGNDREKRMMQK